jgi:hypothetical protein
VRCGCGRRRDGRAIGSREGGRRDGSVWDDVLGRDREVNGGLRGVKEVVVRIIVVALSCERRARDGIGRCKRRRAKKNGG